jgi:hypothetical protein
VFPFLFRRVPTFDLFQSPARWLVVTTVALAALAALGTQWWPVGRRGQQRGVLGVVIGVALLIGGMAGPRLVPSMVSTFGPATARLGVTLAVAGALTLLRRGVTVRLSTRGAGVWQAVVAVFVALDLLLFGWPLVPTVDRSLYRDNSEVAAFLSREPGSVRVYWPMDPQRPNSEYSAEYRVKFSYLTFDDFGPHDVDYWWEMREALLPNAGMLDGMAAANNFDPLLVGWHVDLLEAVVETPSLLRVMGVTHVVSDRPWSGGELVHAGDSAALYRLPDALGRAWIVPSARRVSSDEMLAALADPTFDPAAEVLLEVEPPLVRDSRNSQPGATAAVAVRNSTLVLQDAPNRVTIRASLAAPGYLVLADTWYPGWQATVDGEPTDVLRANYAFRAVSLDAGDYVVEMFYRPLSVYLGIAVSLGMLIVVAAVWLMRQRKG